MEQYIQYITMSVIISVVLYLIFYREEQIEHFQMNIFKKDAHNIYDTFYSELYDELFLSDLKNVYEAQMIKELTFKQLAKKDIRILDLGCGTGRHLRLFDREGYNVTGVDNSNAMIQKANKNTANAHLVQGDFLKSSLFKSRRFTHIVCLFFTIYYINNPKQLFRNCNKWLLPKGYLCVHLVNKKKFDPVLEKASSLIPLYNPQHGLNKQKN